MAGVSRRGALLFAAMCVLWGVPYLLIRVAVRDMSPASIVFLRTAGGAVLLLPLVIRRRQFAGLLGRWRPLLAFAAVEVAAPWWLLTDAERHLTSSLSGLIVAAVPLIGIPLNHLTGGEERIDRFRLAGLVLGFSGVVALLGLQLGRVDMVAVAQVLLVAVGYAVGPIILTRSLADLPGTAVIGASLGISAIVYAVPAALTWPARVSANSALSVATLAAVCTAVAFLVFFALIREIGPTRATVITFVNPAVALALGVLVLSEPVTVGMAVGFPLVLAGSVLATRRPPDRVPAPSADGRFQLGQSIGDLRGEVDEVRRHRLGDLHNVRPADAERTPGP